VSHENFALGFKNATEVIEFIDREKTIGEVKDAIDLVFRKHKQRLNEFIINETRDLITPGSGRKKDKRAKY
jgi:hypothetical protein